tara:strand:+ start:683 stop:886 length:204 start_codon:yes stop_codon:yes gene_type:complete
MTSSIHLDTLCEAGYEASRATHENASCHSLQLLKPVKHDTWLIVHQAIAIVNAIGEKEKRQHGRRDS